MRSGTSGRNLFGMDVDRLRREMPATMEALERRMNQPQRWAERTSTLSQPREACDYPWRTRDNAHHLHTCVFEHPHHPSDTRHVCLCGASEKMTVEFYAANLEAQGLPIPEHIGLG